MKTLKDTLTCVMIAAVLIFFFLLAMLIWDADKFVKAVPIEIERADLNITAELAATRKELLGMVDRHATIVERTADERLIAIQQMVDERTGQALQMTDTRLGELTTPVAMAQANLYGAVENLAALEKDIQDSLDDLYPDIKASTESATVAITSAAQASEAMRDAAPRVTASVEGVAADMKREADSVTAPKKWWQKLLGPVYTAGRLVAVFM